MNRYLTALLLLIATATIAQDAPEPKDGAAVETGGNAAASKPPADTKEIPEEFAPTDELSEDTSAAFPVDI